MLKALKSKQNGITLIALIITIIVLLILAGVTIAAISSNESAPNKAVEARQKNEQGAEFDAIKVAAVSSIADGDYTLHVNEETLKRGLTGLIQEDPEDVITAGASEWVVTGNSGVKYRITNLGNVTLASTVDIEKDGEIVTSETLTFAVSAVGSTVQLTAKPTADLTLNSATWASSTPSVATVSNSGLVTIVGGGETTITLTATTTPTNTFTKTVTIKVAQAVSSMTLSTASPLSIKPGKNGTITVSSITPSTNVEDIVFELDETNAAGAYFGTVDSPTSSTTVPVGSGATASATINIPSNAEVDAESTVTIKGASSGAGSVTCKVKVAQAGATIGSTVTYSTTLNGETLSDWKVFHKETKGTTEYTWIILADYLPNSYVSSTLRTNYNLTNGNGAYCIKSNSRTNLINAMSTTTNWSSLLAGTLNGTAIDLTDDAATDTNIKAMGSPTIQLWSDSWNDNHTGETNDLFIDQNSTGYLVKKGSAPGSSDYYASMGNTGTLASLYFPHTSATSDNCYGYWLASPSASNTNYVMYVNYDGIVDSNYYNGPSYAFRPVVCLPSSVFE